MLPRNAAVKIPLRNKKGNRAGITVLMQRATPWAPPEKAVRLSRIRASMPNDAAAAANHLLFSKLPHLGRIYATGALLIHMLFRRGETMKPKQNIKDYLLEKTVHPEMFPVIPIVELAGGSRVLIENHMEKSRSTAVA